MNPIWRLFSAYVVAAIADAVTTYYALTKPTLDHVEAVEANPITAWMFDAVGLVPGLVVSTMLPVAVFFWFAKTERAPYKAKFLLLLFAVAITTYAASNNLAILLTPGIFQ